MKNIETQSVLHQAIKRYRFVCCTMLLTLSLCSCTATNSSTVPLQTSGPILPSARRTLSDAPANEEINSNEGVAHAVAVVSQSDTKNNVISALHTTKKLPNNNEQQSLVSHAEFVTDSKNHNVTPASHIKKAAAQRIEQAIDYAMPDPKAHPDEYLWDGGDRDYPVHFNQFNRLGLDTEDTIAEYSDHTGKRLHKATNRVAIYAPRFNVVRSMSAPVAGASIDKVAASQAENRIAGLDTKLIVTNHNHNLALSNVRLRSRAGGLDSKDIISGSHQSTGLVLHEKQVSLFQDMSFLQTGQFEKSNKPILAKSMLAASTWSKDMYPIIQAQLDAVGQLEAKFQHAEMVGVDNEHLTKGRLRIVKLADKKIAKPGDVITFKIRYDNLGDRELRNIKIIDNLTPRLEYIEDSATSDLAGRLDVELNGEGSLVLKFVLDEPLKGHKGGVITFQTKVR